MKTRMGWTLTGIVSTFLASIFIIALCGGGEKLEDYLADLGPFRWVVLIAFIITMINLGLFAGSGFAACVELDSIKVNFLNQNKKIKSLRKELNELKQIVQHKEKKKMKRGSPKDLDIILQQISELKNIIIKDKDKKNSSGSDEGDASSSEKTSNIKEKEEGKNKIKVLDYM